MANIKAKPYSILKDVKIGKNARIFPQTNLYKCKIGNNCKIDSYVYIEEDVELGSNVKIRPFTFIPTGVTIEDDVFIAPSVTFTNDMYPRVRGKWRLLKTLVKRGASIGARSVILPGITIGEYALIAAGSVVTKDVAPYEIVAGSPARVIGSTIDTKFKKKVREFLAGNNLMGEESDWPWP